ncbi:MAG: hypothetical protein ACRDJF_11165, partial [Actinomycetota bacterium]
MIATAVSPVFRIERAYDRGYASPGPSRLRNYLRSRRAQIEEQVADHGAPGWASMVWDIATPPIMWPGFVVPGPEVMGCRPSIDDRDPDPILLLEVDLATERFPGPRWPAGVGSGWRRRYDVEMEEAPLTPGRP